MIRMVVSGGQTGVDRAALDAAREQGFAIGGWCPQGRRAEDGRIPARYPLVETPLAVYRQRTLWNVRDSDGTLILYFGSLNGGTALTAEFAIYRGKPLMKLDLHSLGRMEDPFSSALAWIRHERIEVLNAAGPREPTDGPSVYAPAKAWMDDFLRRDRLSSGPKT